MKKYSLPPRFYEDHRSRDLPETGVSVVTGKSKGRLVVEMDDAALHDLYTDACYYADAAGEMGMPGLAASARATRKALEEQR